MGDGRREEDRSSLSFNAWIAIAVGLLVVVVLGLHVPVYLRYRYVQRIIAKYALHPGRGVSTEVYAPPWPMSVLADRWESYGMIFCRAVKGDLASAATDADAAEVAGLASLVWLNLNDTRVTDAGLGHLGGLTKLRDLHLCGTRVTDAGLVHLAELPKLEWLVLANTLVTDAGVAAFNRKLPLVTVYR